MKIASVVAFLIAAVAVTNAAAFVPQVDTPQDGQMNHQSAKDRVRNALVQRNAGGLQSATDVRSARRARQSCIADFHELCAEEAAKVGMSRSVADTEDDADFKKSKKSMVMQSSLVVGGGGNDVGTVKTPRRRIRLRGMEKCLSKQMEKIQNPTCKAYMEGRETCLAEAEPICAQSVKDRMQALDHAAAQSLEQQKALEAKKKALSVAILGKSRAAMGFGALAGSSDVRVPKGMSRSEVQSFMKNQFTLMCIRDTEKTKFSPKCVNSPFYTSILVQKFTTVSRNL